MVIPSTGDRHMPDYMTARDVLRSAWNSFPDDIRTAKLDSQRNAFKKLMVEVTRLMVGYEYTVKFPGDDNAETLSWYFSKPRFRDRLQIYFAGDGEIVFFYGPPSSYAEKEVQVSGMPVFDPLDGAYVGSQILVNDVPIFSPQGEPLRRRPEEDVILSVVDFLNHPQIKKG